MIHSRSSISMVMAIALLVPMAMGEQGSPQMKRFGDKVYDVSRWPNMAVPNFSYRIFGTYNGVPGAPVDISGHPIGDNSGITWTTIKHFPYDPKDFYGGDLERIPARPLFCKALLSDCHTNFTASGKAIYINITYDCGEPMSGK